MNALERRVQNQLANLPNELRARARYGQLIAVVGQPHTADERELLTFMARWLSDNDADLLVGLIRRHHRTSHRPRPATRYRDRRAGRACHIRR